MSIPISPQTLEMLEVLKRVAAETLEKKRRLGHYAVVWKDGQPVLIGDDAPSDPGAASETQSE